MMLREIKNVSKKRDEPKKRWFSSPDIDLFTWFDNDDSIKNFIVAGIEAYIQQNDQN